MEKGLMEKVEVLDKGHVELVDCMGNDLTVVNAARVSFANHKKEFEAKDEKLRFLAEMENLRKRSDRDRIDSIKYGSVNFARDVLSPGDNLERALDALPEDEKVDGVENPRPADITLTE